MIIKGIKTMTEQQEIIDKAIINATEELMKSDKFKSDLQTTLENSLKKQIESSLQWGKASDLLKEKIEEGLLNSLENVSVPKMFTYIQRIVKDTTNKYYKDIAEVHLVKEIEQALAPAPKEITIQGLLDLLLERTKNQYKECPCDYDENQRPEIEYKTDKDFYTLILWLTGKTTQSYLSSIRRDNHFDIEIRIYKDKIFVNPFKLSDGNMLWDEIREVFMMYAQGTKILDAETFDPDEAELDVAPYDY
jgi:hypothetical protein